LIEAMGFGNCIVANGTEENIEVLNETGLIYKKNDIKDLREKLQYVLNHPDIIQYYGEKAQRRVKQYYSWEAITDKYENLFLQLIKSSNTPHLSKPS